MGRIGIGKKRGDGEKTTTAATTSKHGTRAAHSLVEYDHIIPKIQWMEDKRSAYSFSVIAIFA